MYEISDEPNPNIERAVSEYKSLSAEINSGLRSAGFVHMLQNRLNFIEQFILNKVVESQEAWCQCIRKQESEVK